FQAAAILTTIVSSPPDAVLVWVSLISQSSRTLARIEASARTINPTTHRLRTTVKNKKRNAIIKIYSISRMQTSRRLANEPTKLNSPRAASRRRGLSRNNLRASKEDPPRWSQRGGKGRSLGEETRRAYHRFASNLKAQPTT